MTARELNEKLAKGGVRFYGEVVVVAREKAVERTRGGLIIPDTAQAKQQFAAVVASGDKSAMTHRGWRFWRRPKLRVGDAVYVASYGGVILKQKIDGDVYVLEALYDRDVLLSYRGSQDVELEAGGSQTSV